MLFSFHHETHTQLLVGGQILVLGGVLTVTGSTFTAATLFAAPACMGCIFGVLGGVQALSFIAINEAHLAASAYGAGVSLFVGGEDRSHDIND